MTATLVDEDADSALADSLLVGEGHFGGAWPSRDLAHVRVAVLLRHGLLQRVIVIFVDLLLDDVLVEHLIVELQRFLVDQLIVKAFAVGRFHNVTLGVHAVLVALV